jgi:gas vesicle structural protein
MPVERTSGGTSLIDVLDRVLDKGIVIDAWVRVSLVGIDLITVEARIVVASIDTYLKYSEAVGQVGSAAKPTIDLGTHEALVAENAALRERLAAKTALAEVAPARAVRRNGTARRR